MQAAFTALLLSGWVASAAFAQTSPPPAPPSATAQPQPGAPATSGKTDQANPRPSGSANGPAKLGETRTDKSGANESLASCLAMWDRATHMSQQEWGRACRRVDQRLRSITTK